MRKKIIQVGNTEDDDLNSQKKKFLTKLEMPSEDPAVFLNGMNRLTAISQKIKFFSRM